MHLCLSTLAILLVLSNRWHAVSTIVHLVVDTRRREGHCPSLLWLNHVFAHADQLLDEKLEHAVLVGGLHLGQLLQLSYLNHIRVGLELFLFNEALLLSDQHLLVADDLLVLSI